MILVRGLMVLVLALGVGSFLWSARGGDTPDTVLPPLQIEVLNGCAQDGVAQDAADRLLALGHDVTRVADAGLNGLARTVVLDRRGRDRLSRALARRIGPCPVVLEQVEEPAADVTLILGADWEGLALFSPAGSTSAL